MSALRRCLAAALAIALLLPAAASAGGNPGTTYEVTTTTDEADSGGCFSGDTDCSLREAVLAANNAGADDVINLPFGNGTPYLLDLLGADEELAATGDLDILPTGGALTINGVGGPSIIDGNATDRVFDLRSGATAQDPDATLSLAGVTVTNGSANTSGGAIRNDEGVLSISGSLITSNVASSTGGAIANESGGANDSGSTTITNSGVSGNTAGSTGGAIDNDGSAVLNVQNSSFQSNESTGGSGGTIYNDDTSETTLNVVGIDLSKSASDGGSLFNNSDGKFTLTDVFITNSDSQGSRGGSIFSQNNNTDPNRVSFEMTRGQITGSTANNDGGAIYNQNNSNMKLVDVSITGSETTGSGRGGAIYNQNTADIALEGVTISGSNSASVGGAVFSQNDGLLTAVNSTISGNDAVDEGGAFFSGGNARVVLTNVTVAGNTAGGGAGGIYDDTNPDIADPFTPFTYENTIVAGNTVGGGSANCAVDPLTPVSSVSNGDNIANDGSCPFNGAGDMLNTDPRLGPLQSNLSFNGTHELLSGSPAIDAADNGCPPADQRKVPRPQGAACDIGAFEVIAGQPAAILPALAGPRRLEDLPPLTNGDVGRVANIAPLSGVVFIGVPANAASAAHSGRATQKGIVFVPLTEARQIPVGSFLDTRRGSVRVRTATGSRNRAQTGDFSRGLFQVLQSRRRSARGLTDLALKGGSFARRVCGSPGRAKTSALRRRSVRRLRSNARGRFRTRGRHSAATVRGTVWETTDRCDGTLTKVTRGSVVVRDLRRRRNVVVRAGKRTKGPGGGRGSYLARAR